MRILYGCNSQGQGHLGKAAVLVPLLEARGNVVRVLSSGPQPPANLRFSWHRHVPGLIYAIEEGRANASRTALDWLRSSPRLLASLKEVRQIVQEFEPELILSDFEPFTACPLLSPPCEVVSVCRQAALLDPAITTPEPQSLHAKLVRSMIRMFLMGADRRLGYHYAPSSHRCIPPVIRPELFQLQPQPGEHVLVYNHCFVTDGEAERLIEWANDRRLPVRAYGFPQMPRGEVGYVRFQPSSRPQMMLDMASSRAVMTTAGLTTPAEAFLLGKPVAVVPLRDQWEQSANAMHLADAKLAVAFSGWNYDAMLEVPSPRTDHPLVRWLTTTGETVLDAILGHTGNASQRSAA